MIPATCAKVAPAIDPFIYGVFHPKFNAVLKQLFYKTSLRDHIRGSLNLSLANSNLAQLRINNSTFRRARVF